MKLCLQLAFQDTYLAKLHDRLRKADGVSTMVSNWQLKGVKPNRERGVRISIFAQKECYLLDVAARANIRPSATEKEAEDLTNTPEKGLHVFSGDRK